MFVSKASGKSLSPDAAILVKEVESQLPKGVNA
jgi:hypothetical protein